MTSIYSPISKLPCGILLHVFSLASHESSTTLHASPKRDEVQQQYTTVNSWESRQKDPTKQVKRNFATQHSLSLSQVCSAWLRLAKGCSSLWKTITVPDFNLRVVDPEDYSLSAETQLLKWGGKDGTCFYALVEIYLERSGRNKE